LDNEYSDSFKVEDEPKSSAAVLDAIRDAEKAFQPWWEVCARIDKIIDATQSTYNEIDHARLSDQEFDLYWASLEIIKPAVYSRPPQPVVSPRFPDRDKTAVRASELLERCLASSFDRGDFDQVMIGVRDDLCTDGRGVPWVYYETGDKGKRVCEDHIDRCDFLHEPSRKWAEVGWAARAAYLTRREFKARFPKADDEAAEFKSRRKDDDSRYDTAAKCKVWEVWHKADERVYWVTEGVDTLLDESAPFLDIEGFYPCPRPAYGTLKRRQLIPVPDYVRYARTLDQINELTRRVHALLSWVKVKGMIPAGGDVGEAVEAALASTGNDDVLLIPVPAAALMQGSNGQFVQFLPLQEFAAAITGLLEARRELIQNFYELSGISDIMRGATDAGETLGAQQLKSQFGSVRVREKVDELQRVARDVARITAEIIAEKFTADDIQDMAQMKLPTRAKLKKSLDDLEAAARQEMEQIEAQAMDAAEQARALQDPAQSQQLVQQFEQAQQQVMAKYQPQIASIRQEVPIEDVMDLFRDQKARAFAIEIETDSTIMVDEMAEKQNRGEFLQAFTGATASIQPLLAAGEAGATLAGGMIKFALAPYRAGRELDGMIDDFIEAAPQIMEQAAEGDDQGLAEAQMKLAEAETIKAQAAMENVKAKAAKDQADMQGKMQELQAKASKDQQDAQLKVGQLQLQLSKQEQDFAARMAETEARINKMQAETAKILQSIGLDARKQDLEEYRAAESTEARQVEQAMNERQKGITMDGSSNG
jgi:hypothetical protein